MEQATRPAESLSFTRINNDTCGNPRYVIHFLSLNTPDELDKSGDEWIPIGQKYDMACKRANAIGGRKYNTKAYGGGIVFQSYSLDELRNAINRATGRNYTEHTVSR